MIIKKHISVNRTAEWLNDEVNGKTRFEDLWPQMVKILLRAMPKMRFDEAEDAVQEYLGYASKKDSFAVELEKGNEIYVSNLVDFCRQHFRWTSQPRGTQIIDRIYNNVKSHAEQSKDVRYKTENGIANTMAKVNSQAWVDLDDCKSSDEDALAEFEQPLKSEALQTRLFTAFRRLYDDKGEIHYKVFMEEAYQWEETQQQRADKLGVTLRQYRELNTQNNETIKYYGREFFGL